MKTSEYFKKVKIYFDVDLIVNGVDVNQIQETILNKPFRYWNINNFNSLKLNDDQLVDLFVFETYNSLLFNVNDIF